MLVGQHFQAGAAAGLFVDVTLFPLDTLKTRIQSEQGFWKAGGFREIYKGIGPIAVGSAPCGKHIQEHLYIAYLVVAGPSSSQIETKGLLHYLLSDSPGFAQEKIGVCCCEVP